MEGAIKLFWSVRIQNSPALCSEKETENVWPAKDFPLGNPGIPPCPQSVCSLGCSQSFLGRTVVFKYPDLA